MPPRPIVHPSERPVVRDDEETLWNLAQVATSKDVTLNDHLEIAPPSREALSPVQSRKGREREELARTWRFPRPPQPPSLPSSTRMLPYETQRWSTVQPYFPPPPSPPSPSPPPPPPPPPPRRRALAPIDPNIAALAAEIQTLERENAALKAYTRRQKRALVVVARLHEPPL